MAYAEVVFSEPQQLALLGHAISDTKVFDSCSEFGVSKEWFTNPNAVRAWSALTSFHGSMHRRPTVDELKSHPDFTREDDKIRAASLRAVDMAMNARVEIGYDSLVTMLREWSVARLMRSSIEKTVDLWNRGDIGLALQAYREGVVEMEKVDTKSLNARCQDAPSRARVERAERIEQSSRILSYGVTYIDEATGGILPNDLILIGAKTGFGKTQLVTRIAAKNAQEGKKVALFALEAEEHEIERRLKFMIYGRAYRLWVERNGIHNATAIDYARWRLGQLEKELAQFEDGVNKHMEKFSTLQTIYRKGGDYGIDELERDIVRVAPTTDLIIIDHLHYVDVDDQDENRGTKGIVKKLRDLALGLGKPIILVAHMRKTQGGKYAPLLPSLEDFHGSSDIIKIATTAIILGPCYGPKFTLPVQEEELRDTWATYIRIAKCRLEGSRLRYTGVGFFDPQLGSYRDTYAVGHLVSNDCHWDPEQRRPHWAKSASILLHSTNI